MRTNRSEALPDLPRKSLAAGTVEVRKPIADSWHRAIGQAIERAINLAAMSKQDVAYHMGYADQSALARWISGTETAQLSKLFAIEALREPLVIALAEIAEMTVETRISTRRRR